MTDRWICVCDSGTLEDTELVDGLVFSQKVAGDGGPKRIEKAKIGLIQFCISPPKTDVSLSDTFYIVLQRGRCIQYLDWLVAHSTTVCFLCRQNSGPG